MRFSILTLGCKVNQSESDIIEGNLIEHGHSVATLCEEPDYCIVNTCSVTAKSDYQSRQLVRRALRHNARVIATGCYAELRPGELRRISRNILIVRNADKYNIINILDSTIECINLCYSSKSRASIKIQDGCNHRCTYCIVPYARGKSRSVDSNDIVDQISGLASKGFQEVVLTGIHLGSYGYDLKPKLRLSDLLTNILNSTLIRRVRLSSLGVNEIDGALLDLLSDERICDHLHIPLQSGDNSVLRHMRRAYDATAYAEHVSKIILRNPNIAVGTDVIVGFPGEAETAFQNTVDIIKDIPFAYLHVFPFSARPGTPASSMPEQTAVLIRKRRSEILQELSIRKKMLYGISQINRILDLVIEDKASGGGMIGRSSNYLKVRVRSQRYPKKSLVAARVTEWSGEYLKGVPVENL